MGKPLAPGHTAKKWQSAPCIEPAGFDLLSGGGTGVLGAGHQVLLPLWLLRSFWGVGNSKALGNTVWKELVKDNLPTLQMRKTEVQGEEGTALMWPLPLAGLQGKLVVEECRAQRERGLWPLQPPCGSCQPHAIGPAAFISARRADPGAGDSGGGLAPVLAPGTH